MGQLQRNEGAKLSTGAATGTACTTSKGHEVARPVGVKDLIDDLSYELTRNNDLVERLDRLSLVLCGTTTNKTEPDDESNIEHECILHDLRKMTNRLRRQNTNLESYVYFTEHILGV